MTAQQRDILDRLFVEAQSLSPDERLSFLAGHCPDPEVRRELESLLAFVSPAAVTSPFAEVIEQTAGDWALSGFIGQRVGPYRITGRIGHGGMGSVYMAVRDDDEFQKTVAIKMLRFADGDPILLQRFRRERQILASLEHPHIARLMDGGEAWIPQGSESQPYIVMEYVDGLPITAYCERNRLNVRQRLGLVRQACDAISYAHQKLIVHRDIKPDNILVMPGGTVKLLDFGIAKLLDAGIGEGAATMTASGVRMLTPDYASPEQVRGEEVSTVTDVYALGVVLYEMLTGSRPHQLSTTDPLAMIREICEVEVRPPSAIAGRELSGDIDIIVLKALHKEPARRYQSAEQLSEDIRRYLDGLPIVARPDTVRYRTSKFVRRHWFGLAATIALLLAIGGGLGAALHQARIARMRFQQVRKLANTFLFEVWRELRILPGSTPAQALLVKTGLEYVDSLAKEASGDPELQSELADAYEKLGDIQGFPGEPNLGDFEACKRSYQKAVTLREAVHKAYPNEPAYARRLASTYAAAAVLDVESRDLVQAKARAQGCIDLLQAAMKVRPRGAEDLVQIGRCESKIGHIEMMNGNSKQAIARYQRSLTLRQQVLDSKPDPLYRILVAADHSFVASAQILGSDLSGALANINAGVRLLDRNLEERKSLFNTERYYLSLAEVGAQILLDPRLSSAARKRQAVKLLEKAEEISARQVRIDPRNMTAHQDHAKVDRWYVQVLIESDPAEAIRHSESSTAALRDYLAKTSYNPALREVFADLLAARIAGLRATGRNAEAIGTATEALANAREIARFKENPLGGRAQLARSLVDLAEIQGSASSPLLRELLTIGVPAGLSSPPPFDSYNLYCTSLRRAGKLFTAWGEKDRAASAFRLAASLWKQWQQTGLSGAYDAARMAEIEQALKP